LYVIDDWHMGPMSLEDLLAELVLLAEADCFESCPCGCEGKSSDAGEEIEVCSSSVIAHQSMDEESI